MSRFKLRKLSKTQMIAWGYMVLIFLGTLILMSPYSSSNRKVTPFLDAMFTAISASCVTGLVTVDTYQHWSLFGKCIILCLIQIGGLGFMTIGVFCAIILRRKVGLWTRGTLQESVNVLQVGGIVRLAKKIIKGTFYLEGIGALILSIRFAKDMPITKAIFYGVFHSVSAFCNAGFDLMGYKEEYSSFVSYEGDWIVNLTLMSLIVIGGIGFFVWDDLAQHKFNFKKYKLHTKLVLVTTGILIFGGAGLLWLLERNNTAANMDVSTQILSSLFGSVTARTAGFNTTDTGALTGAGKFLTIVLMMIGGSPGSTAGGIKTTTVAILMIYIYSTLTQKEDCKSFGRRLDEGDIRKAGCALCINLSLLIAAVLIIAGNQNLDLTDVIFEVTSAIGTVGMTTGITRQLTVLSKIVIMFLMFCGRVGSLTFAFSLRKNKPKAHVMDPLEQVMVG